MTSNPLSMQYIVISAWLSPVWNPEMIWHTTCYYVCWRQGDLWSSQGQNTEVDREKQKGVPGRMGQNFCSTREAWKGCRQHAHQASTKGLIRKWWQDFTIHTPGEIVPGPAWEVTIRLRISRRGKQNHRCEVTGDQICRTSNRWGESDRKFFARIRFWRIAEPTTIS